MGEAQGWYSIGELARRTGLSVKTIRFYADAGIVPPTGRTAAGYRRYDITALSRLELVRTLRELGVGLADIRDVLDRTTTVSGLARTQLELVDEQLRTLRVRRAVLRAVVKVDSGAAEARLMHKLATMSDAERDQLLDEFWDEVTGGLRLAPGLLEWIRSARPHLPDDPTSDQLEAWLELAELVRDAEFRRSVRDMYAALATRHLAQQPESAPAAAERWWSAQEAVRAAYDSGESADGAHARMLADRIAALFAAEYGVSDGPRLRERAANDFEQGFDERGERFWELLAIINDWPRRTRTLGPAASWLAAALRASAHSPQFSQRTTEPDDQM
ncbi:DNA-binding transcriptional MerR regulator [Tamaricihabitans halophyticus]|uniref:DNA-binding transcriptional MerR regulator n=1 Tax=Tamaricihabitans halophyticus TaxID=1262583 RepID=A0A4R2Q8C6_9PSEU|nr:MerR family transcriptional regulator [Tamaricihabitans halophyticus]TCP44789.1 DNA-binding transcriptional MerR regulator [Tamaricihabitans halophyticus]